MLPKSIILLCIFFLWGELLYVKDIHKEMCLSRKLVHNWVEKFSQEHSKVADDARPGAGVVETTVKRLLAVSFDVLVKRWGKGINVGGGVEKNFFFQVRISQVL
jgi:hypothetical protein